MTVLVDEAVDSIRNLPDEEIIKKYGQSVLGQYPSMVDLQALHLVMAARGIKAQSLDVSLKYTDSKGKEKVMFLASI